MPRRPRAFLEGGALPVVFSLVELRGGERVEMWKAASRQSEAAMKKIGLSYDHLLGLRFAVNVFIGGMVVWYSLRGIADSNPIWALASMIAAADPQPHEALRMFRCRLTNVLVGCAAGLALLLVGPTREWLLPLALAVTVLLSTYVVRVKTMWRQAPITAAVVIAAGMDHYSKLSGIGHGLHKVAEVLFGCFVGVMVSWLMARVWLVRPPEEQGG